MKTDITRFPPHWAKDAIAGQYGWHHPVTGELLVSVRAMRAEVGTNPYTVIEPEDIIMVKPLIDETIQSVAVIDETEQTTTVLDESPVKTEVIDETEAGTEVIAEQKEAPKRRGRPPKNAN